MLHMCMHERGGGWCKPWRSLAEHGSGAAGVEQGEVF